MSNHLGGHLRTVIRPDVFRHAAFQHHVGHRLDDAEAVDASRDVDQSRQKVDINEIVAEVLRSTGADLTAQGIVVDLDLSSETAPIFGNRGQLQQIILNLVNNAIEAMTETIGRKRILRLATRSDDQGGVIVTIQDSGPGISADRLNHIFDALKTTKSRGTGLGLAICQIIVERHGGQLTVLSDGQNGALFQVSIPINSKDLADHLA